MSAFKASATIVLSKSRLERGLKAFLVTSEALTCSFCLMVHANLAQFFISILYMCLIRIGGYSLVCS